MDNIDVEYATKKGVLVVNAPEGNTIAASEHTIALLMAAARNIPAAVMSLKNKNWDRKNSWVLNLGARPSVLLVWAV